MTPYPEEDRFSNPAFRAIEQRVGGSFARSFIDFYAHDPRVSAKELTIVHPEKGNLRLASFVPCDLQAFEENFPEMWANQFPFALVEEGDYLVVPLGVASDDCPVLYYHHDGGDLAELFASFQAFSTSLLPP